jgi:hypothetical protein
LSWLAAAAGQAEQQTRRHILAVAVAVVIQEK